MKTLIQNGHVIDGLNRKAFSADVLIEDDTIAEIGKHLSTDEVDRVINAVGKVIAPGFIDTHSHSDLQVLVNPFNEVKIRQGITTEVLGQDGISMAPLPKKFIGP